MAFLLLLHEKMRLKRQVNKLTLKQTQYGSRLDRMTKNIARVQKMYSSKMTQLEKTAQMAQSQFKSGIMQQLGIGTQGLNPMNFGGMGGTSLFAMNGYNQLAKQLSGGIKDDKGNVTVDGLGDNALAIVQAVVSGNISKNYKEGSTSDVVSGAEWKVGRFNTGFGQRVEQGRFPDVGQTDDTAFESHDLNHLNLWIINLLQETDCRKLNSFAYYTRCAAKMPHDNGLLRLKGVQTVGRFGQPVL